MLVGRSALGVVSQGGFIPWDDNLDLNMPCEDYVKFIELGLFDKELSDKYELATQKSHHDVSNIYDKIYKRNI